MGFIHKLVYHNDRILPLDDVRLSPGQAALFNGWGIFTTMRMYDGRPFAFERHWNRLMTDARLLQLPVKQTPEQVRTAVAELVRANSVVEGCIRVYFLYNKVGVWCSDEPMPTTDFLMYTTDLPKRVGPTRLGVQAHGRYAANPLTGRKVTSWLQNVFSLEQAHQRGFEETLLLNERDEVAECTAANVYCVRAGTVETPPLTAGCLAGVSRQLLLEIVPELGISIKERDLKLRDLYDAEEVFITSTTREVQAVAQIEDQKYANAPGPLTTRLARAFSEYVKRYISEQKQAREVTA